MSNPNYNQYRNTVNTSERKPNPSDGQPVKDQVEGRFEFKPLKPGDIPKSKNGLASNLIIIGIFAIVFGAIIAWMLLTEV